MLKSETVNHVSTRRGVPVSVYVRASDLQLFRRFVDGGGNCSQAFVAGMEATLHGEDRSSDAAVRDVVNVLKIHGFIP